MLTRISAIDTVVTVGVDLHVELFSQLYQVLGILGDILKVYIIVGHAVY